jgi:uncharacterized membrane protein
MTDAPARRRPSPFVIVAFVLEILLLVLFLPALSYSEVLQAQGPDGRNAAIGLAVIMLMVAIALVAGSVVAYLRARSTGASVGFALAAIGLGALIAISHAGITLPGALT